MNLEPAAPPADEQPDGEADDQEPDGGLRSLLNRLGQIRLEEDDRQAEGEERRRMADSPGEAEPRGEPRRPLAAGGDQRRHGGEVVRVGRMAEAEQDRHADDGEQGGAAREVCDPVVEPEHLYVTFGSARRVIARPRPRTTSALIAGRRRIESAVEVDAAEDALRADGDDADRRHRAGEAEAEGDDQDEPVADAVEGDRREQDDECGRARDDPAGDADAEQPPRAERVVVRVVVSRDRGCARGRGGGRGCVSFFRHSRTRQRSTLTPTATISNAETRFSQGKS